MKGFPTTKSAAVLLLTAVLCGCYRVDYVGKYYEAGPEDRDVIVYHRGRETVPDQKYAVIGRMTIVARYTNSIYHLEDYAAEQARKRGADAIEILGVDEADIGYFTTDADEFGAPVKTAIPANAELGNPAPLKRNDNDPTTKPRIRIILYKDKGTVEKLRAQ